MAEAGLIKAQVPGNDVLLFVIQLPECLVQHGDGFFVDQCRLRLGFAAVTKEVNTNRNIILPVFSFHTAIPLKGIDGINLFQ